ncbi:hypothetical protein JD844_001061 [Phrynosoma platyrhinos]|uniref:Receptor ligand binding region domain-containing protein n=1 Tax=Phrynosoma platyrhinos TaxID=52577 RepID=A0ABQ7T9V0_PHRPL|nr:hypothetical protein JD844_001061 [Phrynosoma platyrhinos]
MVTKFYQHILSMIFAVKEINKNPKILPNLTLGLKIYDTYNKVQTTYHSTLNLLFKSHHFFLNYECDSNKKLIAVIGALASETSFDMAKILSIYKIPQLTYASFAQAKNEMKKFNSLYQMVSNEVYMYGGIISLLKHFGWTWIGLFVANDDSGEQFLQRIEPLLSENGICLDFTEQIKNRGHFALEDEANLMIDHINHLVNYRKSRVFVLYGDTFLFTYMWYHTKLGAQRDQNNPMMGKVWILTARIEFILTGISQEEDLEMFQGAIAFMIHSNQPQGFWEFLQSIQPDWSEADDFLKDFWEEAFDCSAPNPRKKISGTCSEEKRLENLIAPSFEMDMTGPSYTIYNAVYAVAHALHVWYSSRINGRAMTYDEKDPFAECNFLR